MKAGVMAFPCKEGGASAKAPYTRRGFKEATCDLSKADLWSTKYPGAVWGLPCALNGVVVLDADRHGRGDGVDNIMTLFESNQFDWRTVPVVATPNGGYHFYFNRPAWTERTRAKLCKAVDIRDNGYVIAPGCKLLDGRGYRVVGGTLRQFSSTIASRDLIYPPAWLVPMMLHPPAPPPREITEGLNDEILLNQIKGIIGAALRAEDGSRNMLLFWAACRLAEMVKTDLLAHEWAEAVLEETGSRLGLPAHETRATVSSALRKGREGNHNAR